jgi:hypothetical protein
MAELRASPVVNPSYKRIADVLANLQGPMGEIIPFTDANPFKFLMPAASTFENLAYGNAPLAMPPGVTNRRLPIVKTGREGEFTDLASLGLLATGVPQVARGAMQGANYLGDVLTQATRAAPPAAPMRAVSEIAEAAPITPKPLPPEPVRSDIGFYSQLEAATNPLQDKGTGDQFLSQLQKSAGVKPDEIKYTGLDEFLKGKKAVTKAEIQGYLASNKVDVQEVRLLGSAPLTEQAFNERFARRGFSMVQTDDGPRFRQTDMTGSRQLTYGELPEDIQATIERQSVPQTKHHLGAYQGIKTEIPGGQNYREILLTLPQKSVGDVKAAEQTRDTLVRQTADLMEEWKRLSEEMPGDPRVVELYGRLSETRKARDQAVVDARELRKATEAQNYRSTHFDQPNILAHMRVNDRVVNGKKTLFIEEVQSDWHQAGRKKGYQREKDLTPEQIDLKFIQSEIPPGADPSVYPGYYEAFDKNTGQFLGRHSGTLNREQAMRDAVMSANQFQTGVPNAPFKTSWHELTLKRAIQEASEKGYDQIAFTTGKTQAERYDLSKQVDSLLYSKNPDGTYRVSAQVQGRGQMMGESIPESDLADYVGKEVAEKMAKGTGKQIQVAGKYDPVSMTSDTKYMTELSGEGLKVGGEGMKGFYDQILPKSLEKLGKKFDAKVGKTEMDGVEVWQMDITPKMRESVTTKGQPLFSISGLGAGAIGSGFYQDDTMEQLSR